MRARAEAAAEQQQAAALYAAEGARLREEADALRAEAAAVLEAAEATRAAAEGGRGRSALLQVEAIELLQSSLLERTLEDEGAPPSIPSGSLIDLRALDSDWIHKLEVSPLNPLYFDVNQSSSIDT